MAAAEIGHAVVRALSVIRAHPAVTEVNDPVIDERTGSVRIDIVIEVNLPNAWRPAGVSPSGVRRYEAVRLEFSHDFPRRPPEVSLRPDFGRDAAHIQPWTTSDDRPVPCIVYGRLSEFFFQQGIVGILNQTTVWLERAAEGVLIDPAQGWEPTRRDHLDDYIVADGTALRALVNRNGGHRFQKYEYLRVEDAGGTRWLHGQIHNEQVPLNPKRVPDIVSENAAGSDGKLWLGKSMALVVWPGKKPSGDLVTCDTYTPETVTTLGALRSRAALFGCETHLETALRWLASCVKGYVKAGPFSLAIVLCARRPFDVIGAGSPIELCPYMVDIYANTLFPDGDETPIRPAGHRHDITPILLARMAGDTDDQDRPSWTLLGAGSLGSKVALHLARTGRAPNAIIDRSTMSPHNVARHTLIPPVGDMQILSMDAKARLLRDAIGGFGQTPAAIARDVTALTASKELANEAWSKRSWAVVNTTASLAVREALSAAPLDILPVRVIEAALYAQGQLGLIAAEGPDRNPCLGDLVAEFYALAQAEESLRDKVFGTPNEQLQRTMIGEGCGSLTMPMSDGRLSLYAAGVSEYILNRQRHGLPADGGELVIGTLDPNGLGVRWDQTGLPQLAIVPATNGEAWQVRIHARALAKIQEEVARWPRDETGGVLVGRLSELSHTFNVVDVVPAPKDSTRSPAEFVIGTKGLRKTLDGYAESTGWALYCLGTWHSHLAPSGPSRLDRMAVRAVALARIAPSVLLINTPAGFQALIADDADSKEIP